MTGTGTRHGEVRRAEWDGTWQLQDASGCRRLGPDELKALAEHSLTGPVTAPACGTVACLGAAVFGPHRVRARDGAVAGSGIARIVRVERRLTR
ncbi:hypothetical protein [Streptomyces thermolineatus]|uniref:hypothetical protein n=1 Tax=Streptomyces thermolineatus TaxID=44033 RepID=UPI00384F9520